MKTILTERQKIIIESIFQEKSELVIIGFDKTKPRRMKRFLVRKSSGNIIVYRILKRKLRAIFFKEHNDLDIYTLISEKIIIQDIEDSDFRAFTY